MKKILLVVMCLACYSSFAQTLKEFKASNGKTYHPGDTITIGMGSMPDGNFKYIQINPPLFAPPNRNGMNARKDISMSTATIKKISTERQMGGTDKVIFTIKNGGIVTYNVWIFEALSACEITPCPGANASSANHGSVADELIKLKKLLDEGALTKDEYNAQKKKLLDQ
ncbi:SHOCT domain-containing protein [Mucilaginibacter boryungensis]|nr:SHOCT domain-containing protein [Mucilaginibacter boryungensis]